MIRLKYDEPLFLDEVWNWWLNVGTRTKLKIIISQIEIKRVCTEQVQRKRYRSALYLLDFVRKIKDDFDHDFVWFAEKQTWSADSV